MTENANNPEHGDERVAALSALYRAGEQHEPPDHIEDEILAAARKEVRAGPRRRAQMPTSSPWFIPMATAAVLVLSVSIVVLMRQQSPDRVEPMRAATLAKPNTPEAASTQPAAQSATGVPLETIARLEESESAPPGYMKEDRPRNENDLAAAGANANSAAKVQEPDEPRVARFIGGKRESAAEVGRSSSALTSAFTTPDDWLKEIARLQNVGENQLAAAELKRFHEMNKNMSQAEIKIKLEQFRRALRDASPR